MSGPTPARAAEAIRADLAIRPADGHNALLRYDHARERLAADVPWLMAERDAAVAALHRVRALCDHMDSEPPAIVVDTPTDRAAELTRIGIRGAIRAVRAAADVPDAVTAGETG